MTFPGDSCGCAWQDASKGGQLPFQVGAIVAPQRLTHTVSRLLRRSQWLKTGVNITPYDGESLPFCSPSCNLRHADSRGCASCVCPVQYKAVHVNSTGSKALSCLDEHSGVPQELAELLEESLVTFIAGLRVGAQLCAPSTATDSGDKGEALFLAGRRCQPRLIVPVTTKRGRLQNAVAVGYALSFDAMGCARGRLRRRIQVHICRTFRGNWRIPLRPGGHWWAAAVCV